MALRNTEITLLKDFQEKFKRVFECTPIISKTTDRCEMHSKQLYYCLTNLFGSFYSREWRMPIEFKSRKAKSAWLRSFFDCEGCVIVQGHQNRKLTVDCVNETGIKQVQACLVDDFRIKSKLPLTKRGIFRLDIYGKENIAAFEKQIGFLHPKKKTKLREAINSFVDYVWKFPSNEKSLREFIKALLWQRAKRAYLGKSVRVCSIIKNNLVLLSKHLKDLFEVESKVYGPRFNNHGVKYFELEIYGKSKIEKLISSGLILTN
ncbi:hypothetical protein HZB89_00330 [archaeon]|nr:hypothetical protein [archaeon]